MYLGIFKMSVQVLKKNKARSLLTTLGIVLGTAIVLIMLSVGEGVRFLVLDQLSDLTPETLYVEIQVPTSYTTRVEIDQNTAGSLATGVQITTMKLEDVDDLLELPNIEEGYGMIISQGKMLFQGTEKTVTLFMVGDSYDEFESIDMDAGRFFTEREDDGLSQVIVLGSEVKKSLFGQRDPVGQNVKLEGVNYKVVGIAEEIGTKFFLNMDELAYVPIQTGQKKISGQDYIQAIALRMKNSALIDRTISDVQRILRRNHDIKDPQKDDFVVRTQEESLEIVGVVTDGISLLLFSIAFISLVVGGVGIMNVMFVSVTERTTEIGLKKAVGARPLAIKIQFLSEAVFISAIGGLLGVVLGTGVSWAVSVVAGNFGYEWPFVINFEIILFSFGISAIFGIIFGYSPAKRASKLNPIQAIRRA